MGLVPASHQQRKGEKIYTKARLLKRGVTLFLVAVMVVAGVVASHPGKSQAAAKGTTYNVVMQKGSPLMSLNSIAGGAGGLSGGQNEGIKFQIVVDSKSKTEKVKSTGGTATYYPVTIPAKSFTSPRQEFLVPGGGTAIRSSTMKGDSKGKLYISGGDVDVSGVLGKKQIDKIGDGTADPAGSMIILMTIDSSVVMKETGKNFMQTKSTLYYTTGKSYTIVKGTKSRLEGKAMPDDDTSKALPKPLVGQPIDLNAGTGTLVATGGVLGIKNKTLGMIDTMRGEIGVMKITHASYKVRCHPCQWHLTFNKISLTPGD